MNWFLALLQLHSITTLVLVLVLLMTAFLMCEWRAWFWGSAFKASRRKVMIVTLSTVAIVFLVLSVVFLLPSAVLPPSPSSPSSSGVQLPEKTKKNWLVNRADTAIDGWKRIHNLWEENQKRIREHRDREDEELRDKNAKGLPVLLNNTLQKRPKKLSL